MPPVRFEPTISAGDRQQTYALDRAATGTGNGFYLNYIYIYTYNFVMMAFQKKKKSKHAGNNTNKTDTNYFLSTSWTSFLLYIYLFPVHMYVFRCICVI